MTSNAIVLDLRLLLASLLALSGGAKLLRPSSARVALMVLRLRPGKARAIAISAGGIEIVVAAILAAAPANRLVEGTIAGTLGLAITTVGCISIRRIGSCGCSGIETTQLSHLIVRNVCLFGGLALTAAAGPSLDALEHDAAPAVATIAFMPLVIGAGVAALRVATEGRQSGREIRALVGRFAAPLWLATPARSGSTTAVSYRQGR